MERRLKERLLGVTTLVMLAVIFIPIILDGPEPSKQVIEGSNIPDFNESEFNTKLISIEPKKSEPLILEAEITQTETSSTLEGNNKQVEASASQSNLQEQGRIIKNKGIPELEIEKADSVGKNYKDSLSPPLDKKSKAKVSAPVATKKRQHGLKAWAIQLASFNSKENAEKLIKKLKQEGYPAFITPITKNGNTIYRVKVGPELLRSNVEAMLKKLHTFLGKKEGVVVRYP